MNGQGDEKHEETQQGKGYRDGLKWWGRESEPGLGNLGPPSGKTVTFLRHARTHKTSAVHLMPDAKAEQFCSADSRK